jgi:cell division protein FtsQ
VVAALVGVVYLTPLFALRAGDVQIRGLNDWVSQTTVMDSLKDDVGRPLAQVNRSQIGQRLEGLDAVAKATVRRAWPNGLMIDLTAREPAAAAAQDDGYSLLDSAGYLVAVVPDPPEGLPVINVPLGPDNQRTVRAVLSVVTGLPPTLRQRVTTIGAATEDTVEFTLDSGVVVLWGGVDEPGVKAAAVELLLGQPDVNLIDVSAAEFPVIR